MIRLIYTYLRVFLDGGFPKKDFDGRSPPKKRFSKVEIVLTSTSKGRSRQTEALGFGLPSAVALNRGLILPTEGLNFFN